MKERPILFKGEMVRAILDGRKTQTRRMAIDPELSQYYEYAPDVSFTQIGRAIFELHRKSKERPLLIPAFGVSCKYGVPGDRLWVKETWSWVSGVMGSMGKCTLNYRADGAQTVFDGEAVMNKTGKLMTGENKWRPSIFMPRWASRITLEIIKIRVERLQDITEEDAIAEGIEIIAPNDPFGRKWRNYYDRTPEAFSDPRKSYRSLWESINGKDSWDANPWVWVIEWPKYKRENAA